MHVVKNNLLLLNPIPFFSSPENFYFYFCPSLCVNNLYIWLLIRNLLSDFDETWSQWSPIDGDQNIYLKRVWLPRGLRGGAKWGKIVLNLLTTSPTKPLVRFWWNLVTIITYRWGSESILEKCLTSQGAEGRTKWGKIVLNLLTTSPKPRVRFWWNLVTMISYCWGSELIHDTVWPPRGRDQMGSNSAKSSNDFLKPLVRFWWNNVTMIT